jgi:hypothetical protein
MELKRMTARQESRPEEMPFDEPAEEPPSQRLHMPNRRWQMIREDPPIHSPLLRLNSCNGVSSSK